MENGLKASLMSLGAFLTACTITITASPPTKVKESYSTPEAASFKIICRDKHGNDRGAASGVIIGVERALTAAHVVDFCRALRGTLFMGDIKLTTLKVGDQRVDLALLAFRTGMVLQQGVALAQENPKVGTPLIISAYPGFMDDLILTRGVVSGYYRADKESPSYGSMFTDALITFGDSGGGAFNEQGELVGIISALIRPESAPHYVPGMIVPIEAINEFLRP